MVSASDRRNFTSRALAILFRSPINRLRKLLMTSCFIMRGSWHALVTPPFMASITASNDSVRPWTITFWRRQHKRQHRSGAPELRLRKLHLLPLHCLQSNLKERYAFGLLVHNNPGEVIKTAPGRCGAFKRSSLCTASPQTSAMASFPLSMSRSWVTTGVWKSRNPESGIRNPESGIGTGIETGTGTGTGIGTGMGRETYIKAGTTFTLI